MEGGSSYADKNGGQAEQANRTLEDHQVGRSTRYMKSGTNTTRGTGKRRGKRKERRKRKKEKQNNAQVQEFIYVAGRKRLEIG